MGVIIYNGISSADLGIQVSTFPKYVIPERDYNIVHVPGRNGDILFDNGTFKNVTREYEISVAALSTDYYTVMNRVAEWLHSSSGYTSLEDSYEPDFYRLAVYRQSVSFENIFNSAGRATISFDCKPQRFLKSGDEQITVSNNTSIFNDTSFSSLPIITVGLTTGQTGTLSIGRYSMSFHSQTEAETLYITINSDVQDVYSETMNCNFMVEFGDGEFPMLVSGSNLVNFTGGVTSVVITPKWWTL